MAARFAVIAGCTDEIGQAIARRVVGNGDWVALIDSDRGAIEHIADDLNATGRGRVTWHCADLRRPEQVEDVSAAIAAEGPVDVLINNVDDPMHGHERADLDQFATWWRRGFDTNVLPAVMLTQALLPGLRRPGGRIVAIGSVAALLGRGAYGASKAALHAWAHGLALRLAAEGVTVNVVAPGLVPDPESERYRQHSIELQEIMRRQVPMERFGTGEEIAAMVGSLIAPDAGYVTGQILQVNGGMVLGRG
ncbi:SDR family NAD(P)-dependent oxidoreductase [Nocardia pneumoniae]|uniref:SDR family NAD(P)-dependent oxidoreductase n=1 Tax=Nocardia pneumoniae TaxID=228601 RepID=UPI0002D8FD5E|nr:SDR family oxidoreductase [Nocardia pneumoniae]